VSSSAKEGSLGRRIPLVVAILATVLFGATGAGAANTLTDPTGDAVAGAADFTQLVVSNDVDGNISFAFTFGNRSTFTPDDTVIVALDSDKNTSTGTSGIDFLIGITASRVALLRGDGTTFALASSPTLRGANNNMTVTINRSDLGATTGFEFVALSTLSSNDAAEDFAPDNGCSTRSRPASLRRSRKRGRSSDSRERRYGSRAERR
jgi:hypothetical protein